MFTLSSLTSLCGSCANFDANLFQTAINLGSDGTHSNEVEYYASVGPVDGNGLVDVSAPEVRNIRFDSISPLSTVWQPSEARGLIATAADSKDYQVYLSWRLLVTDAPDISFNIYRSTGNKSLIKLNQKPITQTTDFIDRNPPKDLANTKWYVAAVTSGLEGQLSHSANLPDDPMQPYLLIENPKSGTHGRRFATGDFDGDGRLDYAMAIPSVNRDPYRYHWKPSKGVPFCHYCC